MASKNIIYGGSLSYRQMCRFQSGFFFRNSLLDEFDWYWRVVQDPPFFEWMILIEGTWNELLLRY
jgi:alpha 1,2-mannosyltransferase